MTGPRPVDWLDAHYQATDGYRTTSDDLMTLAAAVLTPDDPQLPAEEA